MIHKYIKLTGLLFVMSLFFIQCQSLRPEEAVLIPTPVEHWEPFVYIKPTDLGDTLARYRPLVEFGQDTTVYLKANFEGRKGLYVGKPLSKLLDELEVPVQSYSYRFSGRSGDIYTYIRLRLHRGHSKNEDDEYVFNHIVMIIDWAVPLLVEIGSPLRQQYKSQWSEEVGAYYREQIVGDIKVFNHVLR